MKRQDAKVVFVPVGKRRLPALLSGEVDAISVHPPEIIPNVRSGDIRMLAISSPKRVDAYSDVPTLGELGMEVGFYQFRGVFVPKGTPEPIKAKLLSKSPSTVFSSTPSPLARSAPKTGKRT